MPLLEGWDAIIPEVREGVKKIAMPVRDVYLAHVRVA